MAKRWNKAKKFLRRVRLTEESLRETNLGISTEEEFEVYFDNQLEEKTDLSKRRLNKREYFKKLKQKSDADPKESPAKLGRKEKAALNVQTAKLFGTGGAVDESLSGEDCNISGW